MIESAEARVPLTERFTIDGWQDHLLLGVIAFVGLVLLYALLTGGKK